MRKTIDKMKNILILTFILSIFILSCKTNSQKLTTFVGSNDSTLLVEPFGICFDASGTLYIADVGKHCITKVSDKGSISTYAGNLQDTTLDGTLKTAALSSPSGICFDKQGNMFIAGFGDESIRKISPTGDVTTYAGCGKAGYIDGPADSARFSSPRGICIDSKGNIYVGDCWNHRIRKINNNGMVTTFAGGGKTGELVVNAWKDGQDTTARFDAPCGMAIDNDDNIYVADAFNDCIRKITPDGFVTTIAGIGKTKGLKDGPLGVSLLNVPTELFVTAKKEVYFSDTYNNCIRKIDNDGVVSTIAGTGEKGFTKSTPLSSQLNSPRGISIYKNYLYFAEWGNHSIRRMKIEVVSDFGPRAMGSKSKGKKKFKS